MARYIESSIELIGNTPLLKLNRYTKEAGFDEGAEIYIYGGSGKEFTSPEDNQKYRVISVADIIVIF